MIAAPLLFGVPVALGIGVSLIRLFAFRYPDLGWATTVNSDAEELYLGHTLYQNPAHGYTGQIYTPLFPAIVSLFDRIYLWNGWALVLVILASSSLVVLVARLAYSRVGGAPRALYVVAAVGIGCIAYWCVASVKLPVLEEARADQLAWAFALFGLVAVADLGPAPSRRRVLVAVLLLSAALWTKQTTIAVVVPAAIWVLALAVFLAVNRRAALLFVALLCGVNLVLLAVLNLLTHGWEFYFNFVVATRQSDESPYHANIIKGLQCTALAAGFVGATWIASVVRAVTRRRGRSLRSQGRSRRHALAESVRRVLVARDPTGRRALLIALYIVFGFALAMYFMRKQGTETNQLIGVVWGLGLFAAIGWRVAQRHIGVSAVTGGCVGLLFVLVQLAPIQEVAARAEVSIPAFEKAAQLQSVPAELLSYARDHTLYLPSYSDLNVPEGGPLYPNYYNFADLLAAGSQPLYLVRALLDRRFDAVAYFPLAGDLYASANGKWEQNYLWKLNEVIAARYEPEPGLPEGLLGRRPGPEQASWMRDCFGPFTAGGASFRIHLGGGFWCSFSPNRLQLVRTPAPFSEVVTTQPAHLSGMLTVSLEGGPAAHVDLEVDGGSGANWIASVAPVATRPHDLVVSTYLGGTLLGSKILAAKTLPGARREERFSLRPTEDGPGPPISTGPGLATLTAPAVKAPFAVVATNGTVIDLHSMRLGH
ncbi:MAG: hypothetical protein ABSG93_13115 [Solirubrobacteraceae bacterium]